MIYDRNWLEEVSQAAARPDFLFFWGHQASRDGRITASCLSQWWPAPFVVDGSRYPTAEHWMMAEKARLFGDEQAAIDVLNATSPKQAKELGRRIRDFDGAMWELDKRRIVTEGCFHKFQQTPPLREFLISTGTKILVEASPVDRVWGIGLSADDERALDPLRWLGENLLGFALMEVRDRLGDRHLSNPDRSAP